jgi:hypothetical protein
MFLGIFEHKRALYDEVFGQSAGRFVGYRAPRSIWDVIRPQPQRRMSGLHRISHHGDQFLVQRPQIRILAQRGGEGGKGLGRVVLPAVEEPVHERLHRATQRVEQRGDSQRGSDGGDLSPVR